MIDSFSSSNVMPLSICKKLNISWEPCPTQIVQLDRYRVSVVGELRNVLLTLFVDLRIHQTIGIVVVDIPETYGIWLRRYSSEKLKGYFSTDSSHLWLPYNRKPNQIKIVREPFMKQTITDLNDPNELVFHFSSCIEHYTFYSFFGKMPIVLVFFII